MGIVSINIVVLKSERSWLIYESLKRWLGLSPHQGIIAGRMAVVKGLFRVRVEPFGVFGRAAGVFSERPGLNDISLPSFLLTEREPSLALQKPHPAF